MTKTVIKVTVPIGIDFDEIEGCLETAAHHWINYWARNVKIKDLTSENIDITLDEFSDFDGSIIETHNIKLEGIRRALVLMAEKSPQHFADLLNEQADAITGDVLIQYAVFGKIIYG